LKSEHTFDDVHFFGIPDGMEPAAPELIPELSSLRITLGS